MSTMCNVIIVDIKKTKCSILILQFYETTGPCPNAFTLCWHIHMLLNDKINALRKLENWTEGHCHNTTCRVEVNVIFERMR